MSVTSSTTPGRLENSCWTPAMRTEVMAAPSSEESSTRRRELPMVWPYPRSKGSAMNWACVNVNGTRNMIQGGLRCGAEHFVLVSSISVTYPYTTPYSLSKRETERLVKEQDRMKYTIIRPTLAYNEYGGQEFMMFLDYLMKYPVVPFIGPGDALKNPVHVDDLMRGFLAIPNNPASYGKTYPFCGGEALPIRDMAKLMLKHKRAERPFVHLPLPICKGLAAIASKTMKNPPLTWNAIAGVSQHANPDWSEVKADLGYHPIGFREGLQKCFPL
jgi:nucleoside-diphosphate-sugar epimerase